MPKAASPAVDLHEFEEAAPVPRRTCWYSAKIDDAQREKVTAARTAGYSYATIRKVLSDWGVTVGDSSLTSHFNKQCACDG